MAVFSQGGPVLSQVNVDLTVIEYLEKADSARVVLRFEEEFGILKAAREAAPGDAEILWRLARSFAELGQLAEKREDKRASFRQAVLHARKAVAVDSSNYYGYAWLAIAEGAAASVEDRKTQVRLAWQIREHAEQAIALDPNQDMAYHVLARWHHEVAGIGRVKRTLSKLFIGTLPEASYEEAIVLYKRAIALKSDLINHRLGLVRTYLKCNRKEEARRELLYILAMRDAKRLDQQFKEEARNLLAYLD